MGGLRMKKQQILWNHLQYIDQIKAMNKISDLLHEQTDPILKVALTAALIELEIWSNGSIEAANLLIDADLAEENIELDSEETSITKTWIH